MIVFRSIAPRIFAFARSKYLVGSTVPEAISPSAVLAAAYGVRDSRWAAGPVRAAIPPRFPRDRMSRPRRAAARERSNQLSRDRSPRLSFAVYRLLSRR